MNSVSFINDEICMFIMVDCGYKLFQKFPREVRTNSFTHCSMLVLVTSLTNQMWYIWIPEFWRLGYTDTWSQKKLIFRAMSNHRHSINLMGRLYQSSWDDMNRKRDLAEPRLLENSAKFEKQLRKVFLDCTAYL